MNYPSVYIAGRQGYADRIARLVEGDLRILPDAATAIRSLSTRRAGPGFIFYEGTDPARDVQQIRLLRSSFPSYAIILITSGGGLTGAERHTYLQAGVNTALRGDADAAVFERTIRFLAEHAFTHKPVVATSEPAVVLFRMPLWKRTFDVLASGSALVLLSPLLLLTALAIRFDSPGPVIYRSKRVGSNYRVFDFLKFRSMRTDADRRLKEYRKLNQYASDEAPVPEAGKVAFGPDEIAEIMRGVEQGMLLTDDFLVAEQEHQQKVHTEKKNAFVKIENDPRITRLGRFLRKYSIDELPQLINILRGDMSVVGNRPLPLYEAEALTSDEYIERFACPAGLTGLWQVEKRGGRGKLSPEQRKQLDIRYAKTMSPWLDLKILLRTVTSFIQKENV